MQDLSSQVTLGNLTAAEFNEIMNELQRVIESMGIVMSTGDLTQIAQSIAQMSAAGNFYSCSGPADAYVCAVIGSQEGIFEYSNGTQIRFRPSATNTGISTVNVNGLGLKTIKRDNGDDLQAGDLDTARDAAVRYDGTDFLLMNQPPDVEVPTGYIEGSTIAFATTTTLTFNPGVSRDSADSATIRSTVTWTKSLSNFAVGNTNGGFPSALTLTADTWYRVFHIMKADGTIDFGFDTSATATNLLTDATGYTKFRRVGWILTNGSSQITNFIQDADDESSFIWDINVQDVSETVPATTVQTKTMSAPPNSRAKISANLRNAGSTVHVLIYASAKSTPTVSESNASLRDLSTEDMGNFNTFDVEISSTSTLKYKADVAAGDIKIQTQGWFDKRRQA